MADSQGQARPRGLTPLAATSRTAKSRPHPGGGSNGQTPLPLLTDTQHAVLRGLKVAGDGCHPKLLAALRDLPLADIEVILRELEEMGLARPWSWQPTELARGMRLA